MPGRLFAFGRRAIVCMSTDPPCKATLYLRRTTLQLRGLLQRICRTAVPGGRVSGVRRRGHRDVSPPSLDSVVCQSSALDVRVRPTYICKRQCAYPAMGLFEGEASLVMSVQPPVAKHCGGGLLPNRERIDLRRFLQPPGMLTVNGILVRGRDLELPDYGFTKVSTQHAHLPPRGQHYFFLMRKQTDPGLKDVAGWIT